MPSTAPGPRRWCARREAAQVQAEQARHGGPAALRRVELLHLRFHDGLPIREIAERWQADAAQVHHDYARARQEFKAARARRSNPAKRSCAADQRGRGAGSGSITSGTVIVPP